ncbi:thioredoxin family protein [Phenylobacterium sp.]|jgi:thiol-disulfide isomerase/thioredoxin|uniref:thioredoxin family protein n=1 Tax=Phenylobacterium sp. TaxID=1871053 RepID=UPI002F3EED56
MIRPFPLLSGALLSGAVLGMALFAAPASAAQAPKLTIESFAELKGPIVYPYDETADANKAVARAKARARARHKLLLVDLGGNWCADCLSMTIDQQPALKAFIDRRYEVVLVDVGRFDRNLQIPAHWGVTERLDGVPAFLVVDPRTDRLLDKGHVSAIEDVRHMTPQAMADWLAQWPK